MISSIEQSIAALPYSQLVEIVSSTIDVLIIAGFIGCSFLLRLFFRRLLEEKTGGKVLADELTIRNRKLRQGINLLDELLNQFPFPVWRRREDLKISYCNQYYCDAIGGEKPVVISESTELLPDSQELAEKAVSSGKPQLIKKHLIDKDNRKLYEICEIPLSNGTIGFAKDLSNMEQLQHEMQQHLSVQSDLMESAPSGIAIFSADKRLRYYNQAYADIWKLEERFFASKPTYGEILDQLRADRKLPEQANFQQFRKEQVGFFTNLIKKHEEFLYLPDGTVLRVIVIPHEHGGLLFSYQDLTQMINLERSYNTLLSVQKYTIDNLNEGLAVYSENGRLKLFNPTFQSLWEYDLEMLQTEPHVSEVIDAARKFFDFDDEGWTLFKGDLVNKLSSRKAQRQKLECSNGKIIDLAFVPLPDGATLATFSDVTDTYRLAQSLMQDKEALEEADTIKTKFLANVSYELRSPLTSIQGFTEVLMQHYFGEVNSKQQEYLQAILTSSKRLAHLIDNIIDVASIDAGYMKLEITSFNLYPTLLDALVSTQVHVHRDNVKVLLECEEDIGEVMGDPKRIHQVVVQLLRNAIRLSSHGGNIHIIGRKLANGFVEIAVQDSGIGIPEMEQRNMFEKFYKLKNGGYSGTGLGLTLARSFVEMHGSIMNVESEENKGTRISFTLKSKQNDQIAA